MKRRKRAPVPRNGWVWMVPMAVVSIVEELAKATGMDTKTKRGRDGFAAVTAKPKTPAPEAK